MLTEEGIECLRRRHPAMGAFFVEPRCPHPPASAGTFSLWEKDDTGCGLSKRGSRFSHWEKLSAELTDEGVRCLF